MNLPDWFKRVSNWLHTLWKCVVNRNMRCYQTKHSRNFLSKAPFSYRFYETLNQIRNFFTESKIPDRYFFYRDQTHLQRQFKTVSLTCFLLSFMRRYWSVFLGIESRENWWVSSVTTGKSLIKHICSMSRSNNQFFVKT